MTKKSFIKVLGLLLVVGLLFAALPVGKAQATTLCVNPGGTDGCYASIQAAINAASAGDTINIAAGTYSESLGGYRDLELFKSLNLIGAGATQTIIQLTGLSHGIEIRPDALGIVKLEGIYFTNLPSNTYSAGWPIIIGETVGTFNSVTLKDVRVEKASARNVHFGANGTYNSILMENCNIHSSAIWGASVAGTTNSLTVKDSVFWGNGANDPDHGNGLDLSGSSTNIKNVLITGGEFSYNWKAGLLMAGVSDVTVSGVKAIGNGKFGISVDEWQSKSQNILIDNVDASSNGLDGITVTPEAPDTIANVDIVESTIKNNTRNGINLSYINSGTNNPSMSDITIRRNNITGNGNKAIEVWAWWVPMPIADVFDAKANWFGAQTGPAAGSITTDNLTYIPWCYTADCNELYVPAGSSIQSAIDVAEAGNIIHIEAGTYTEQIEITKDIKLVGAGADTTTIKAPATLPAASDPRSAIVLVHGAGVEAEISGFSISGPGPSGCSSIRAGVYVYDSAYLNLHDNKLIDIRDSGATISGCQNGVAISVGRAVWSTSGTATIKDNVIINYQKGAIVVDNTGSDALITGNMITGAGTTGITAQNGIQISRGATATIASNTVSGNSYHLDGSDWDWGATGVLLYQAGDVAFTGGNNFTGNDSHVYISEAGMVTMGAETFGASSAPVDKGYYVINYNDASLDLTQATFPTTDPFELAVRIWDGIDEAGNGLARFEAAHLYVNAGGSIQRAIDLATAGDSIHVAAGTYAEDVDVTKAVTLLGPNAGTPGNGTRVDEAVIQGTNASWVSLYVEPDVPGVTIKGFKFDGVNLNPGTSYVVGVAGDSSGLTVQNNVFVNHNDMAIMTSGVYYDNGWKYDKWLTGILIKDNLITNPTLSTTGYNFGIYLQSSLGSVTGNVVTNMRNGIQVQPYWNTPGGGTISGNTFEAYRTGIYFNYTQNATADWDFTGNTVAGIAYPTGVDPVRFNAIRVETFSAGQVDFSYNQVLLGASNATEQYQYFETAVTGGISSATPNWWGSILGPAAGKYSGTAAFDPWCGDAACTFLVSATEPAVSGFYVQDGKLILKGGINVTGGIVINEPLYILLKDGTVIQNSSPCFIVNSSNVTITTESIGGAKCVPTNGANGIDVASALNNITIEGIEFDGTGQTTGDGIHFAGAIQDFVLVDNYLHDLDGDGIEFAGNVAEIVNIQGNMFKANGGSGINNLGANIVGAEYNSWGNVAGPAAGDGVSGLVTSTPFTHADLYLVSSGTPWANQVVKGQQITYTVKAHLVNVNAADFVLTYPAELTYVSSAASGSMGTESVIHIAGAHTLQFIGYNTANLTGDLSLFTVTFTAANNVANAPLSFSYGTTSGFGMVGYESSNNVFVDEMVNGAVTVIDLPTISSTDIQGYYLSGEEKQFSVVLDNPSTGADYAHVYVDFTITNAQVEQISLIEYSVDNGTSWVALGTGPGTSFANVGTDIVGYFGKMPGGGFALAPDTSLTTLFRVTFVTRDAAVDLPTSYVVTMNLMDADALPSALQLDDFSSTMYVYDKATVTVATTDQYLIVGEPGAFTVTINNPTTGRNYDNSVVFDILIPSHAVSDFSALSCSITSPVPFTWNLLPTLVPDGAGGVKARIVGLDGYFEVPPTGVDMVINCSVTVTTAGAYSASGNMVDVVNKVTPVERIVSDSVSLSTVAYLKPVITPTNLGGPFDAGVPETVSLSIANASIPEPFEVVFDYPAGTVIVYDGVTYTCAATCPVIPVELTAEPTVLNFTVTFDEAWTGDVSVGLYDSNWTPADRLLASASATNVVVSGGFAVTGTFSMQGNASRAGIPVTLTWGGTLVTYGPSAETSSAISNNFSVSVLYGGEYTITTLQPRYLNVTADLLKKITVAGPYNMSALLLRGGNAYWRVSDTVLDNIINSGDSSIVGTQYGSSGADAGFGNHGDCNFDGIVNIQDLALVGGNWSLTSAIAYNGTLPWVP